MDDLVFGLQVTVIGLGLVFGLLALVWLLLTVAARLDARGPGGVAAVPHPPRVDVRPLDGEPEPSLALVAAIAIAVSRHVERGRREAAPAMRTYWPGSLMFASRWVAAGRMRQGRTWRRSAR